MTGPFNDKLQQSVCVNPHPHPNPTLYTALQVLRRPIKVYTAGLPSLTLGEEFNGSADPLQVCYLRHAFGLGEHYNSLEALPTSQ